MLLTLQIQIYLCHSCLYFLSLSVHGLNECACPLQYYRCCQIYLQIIHCMLRSLKHFIYHCLHNRRPGLVFPVFQLQDIPTLSLKYNMPQLDAVPGLSFVTALALHSIVSNTGESRNVSTWHHKEYCFHRFTMPSFCQDYCFHCIWLELMVVST